MTTDSTSATNAASPLGSASSEGLGLDALRPVAHVQRMGSYQGVPALGCLLSLEAEKRMKVNDPLYDRAALLRVLENAMAVQQHNAELLAECERLRGELRARGPRWADGGDAMAGALGGF